MLFTRITGPTLTGPHVVSFDQNKDLIRQLTPTNPGLNYTIHQSYDCILIIFNNFNERRVKLNYSTKVC